MPVANAFIDVPETGNYLIHVGFEDITHALALIDGKEVYRKDIDGKLVLTKITLEAGKRYPIRITYFKGGKVTLGLANYPMNDWNPDYFIPAIGSLSVWVEEQKLPPLCVTP